MQAFDDLRHARASVDWATAQFPQFQQRLDDWLNGNIYVTVKELPANTPNNVILAMERETLPLEFNVEAGVYINAIRSGLDILASALAARYCPTILKDAYFPVAASAAQFASYGYKGHELVKALPNAERRMIDSIKPYKEGNRLLYALHRLDIERKHKRLLTAEIRPARLGVMGWGLSKVFTPVATGWMRSGEDETVIGILAKGAAMPKIDLTMQVSLNEVEYLEHRPLIHALDQFADLAKSIISQFEAT